MTPWGPIWRRSNRETWPINVGYAALFDTVGYFVDELLIVFLARPRECGGGWVVCGCEVVVRPSRGAGSVAVY